MNQQNSISYVISMVCLKPLFLNGVQGVESSNLSVPTIFKYFQLVKSYSCFPESAFLPILYQIGNSLHPSQNLQAP